MLTIAQRRRDIRQFEDLDIPVLESLNENTFEAVFNTFIRLVDMDHFNLEDMVMHSHTLSSLNTDPSRAAACRFVGYYGCHAYCPIGVSYS